MSEIIVTSAKKLSPQTVAKITAAVKAKKGADSKIVFEIDNALIGGITIRENDVIFDASVENELKNIKNYLSR